MRKTPKAVLLISVLLTGSSFTATTNSQEVYQCKGDRGETLLTDQLAKCKSKTLKSTYTFKTEPPVQQLDVLSEKPSLSDKIEPQVQQVNSLSEKPNLLREFSTRVYKFVDTNGTVHLTDSPKDSRYQLIYEGSGVVRPFAGGSYPVLTILHRKSSHYDGIVQRVAQQVGLEPEFLHAVIHAESAYNPRAVSPKGAVGLMQLMPGTAKRYGVIDRTNEEDNIFGGATYLRDLLNMFDKNKQLALAGYNAGENAVKRYGGIPPYKETRNYVNIVMGIYHKLRGSEL